MFNLVQSHMLIIIINTINTIIIKEMMICRCSISRPNVGSKLINNRAEKRFNLYMLSVFHSTLC